MPFFSAEACRNVLECGKERAVIAGLELAEDRYYLAEDLGARGGLEGLEGFVRRFEDDRRAFVPDAS